MCRTSSAAPSPANGSTAPPAPPTPPTGVEVRFAAPAVAMDEHCKHYSLGMDGMTLSDPSRYSNLMGHPAGSLVPMNGAAHTAGTLVAMNGAPTASLMPMNGGSSVGSGVAGQTRIQVNGTPAAPANAPPNPSAMMNGGSVANNGSNGGNTGGGGGGGSSPGRTSPSAADPAPGKLFVGGLSWQTSAERLKEYFGMFGTVTDVLIMKDPMTQRNRGFGFITFAEAETVEKVLKIPLHTLDGKKIDPKHATPKNRGRLANRTKKIFVGGVSQDTTTEEVKAYFNQFGKVEETVMLMDQQTKRHRGFGFVTFEQEDVVDRVCEIHFHTIKNKKVETKKAQPKEAVNAAVINPTGLLLGKRMMLRVGPTASPTTATQLAAVQAQAAAQVQVAASQLAAQAQAQAGYGKLFGAYPLASYRYAPYPIQALPTTTPAPTTTPTVPPVPGPANPYQAYSLSNVDMSSFQGVDWSSMYGMGMYV